LIFLEENPFMVRTVLVATAGLLLATSASWAQNPTGSLRGTVQDSTGARIPSAAVSIDSTSSLHRAGVADSRGEFRVDDLPVGDYKIVVSANGFADAASEVTVQLGSVREVVATLKPSVLTQTVTVQGQASSITTQPLDPSSVVHQTIITSQDLAT